MVAGDLLFVGSCEGTLYALNRSSGKVQWSYDIKKDGLQTSFHGDPLVVGDLVLVGTDGGGVPDSIGHLYAFVRATGQVTWKYRADKGVATDILRIGSRLYAVASGTKLVCLDLKSGRARWIFSDPSTGPETLDGKRSESAGGASSPNPESDPDGVPPDRRPGPASLSPVLVGRRVFFATARGSVYAVNARSGGLAWKRTLPGPITTDLAAAGEFLYVGTSAGHLYRLSLKSGAVAGDLETRGRPFGNPVVAGGSLIVLLAEDVECCDMLAAMDLPLTKVLWERKAPRGRDGQAGLWTTFRPRAWRGMVLAGTDQGVLAALHPSDGSWAWSRTLQGRMRGIGSDEEGVLYIGSVEGALFAFVPEVSEHNRP